MNDALKQALDFAKYQQTFAVQRKVLNEKNSARLTYGYNGGIFKVDKTLLVFVQMLIDQKRTENIPIFDSNGNPILVTDVKFFRDEIFDRYFTSSFEYYQEFEKLKKSRSIEKLLDL